MQGCVGNLVVVGSSRAEGGSGIFLGRVGQVEV